MMLIGAVLAAATQGASAGAPAPDPESRPTSPLETVVVTATRGPRAIEDVAGTVTAEK